MVIWKRVLKVFFALLVLLFLTILYWTVPHGFVRPDVSPPANSENVRFYVKSGWQLLRYYYRIDNEPEVSIEFAKTLMKSSRGEHIMIITENFDTFPITGKFPKWFNPNSIVDGTLVTGDDWIYAVIDNKTGRMFYYDGY